ncbi:MAG: histidine phosphatase family protein [Propionibacterium acidifaciens]
MGERTVVHVMRHGEVHNPDGILYERLPGFRLSANGLAMARAVAEAFVDVPLTHLRTSPLQRAVETIEPFAATRPGLEVVTDERLTEAGNRFVGQVFGRHHAALWRPRNWPMMLNPLRPSWGEPFADIARRMTAALADAAGAAGPGGQALVVSHQSPIWIARRAFEGKRPAHLPGTRTCSLASITSFHFEGVRCVGITYSEPAARLLGADGNAAFSSGD